MLLIFPLNNRPEPLSLWSALYPGEAMRWEWDENGDDRVSKLWHLRAQLSTSREVVYSKWFQGRATAFSRELFTALLALSGSTNPAALDPLDRHARDILSVLQQDSPQSAKTIREATNLKGKNLAPVYERSLKALWRRFLLVGFGEIDDGAFPSLAVGATRVIFEDLWSDAMKMDAGQAREIVEERVPVGSVFRKAIDKDFAAIRAPSSASVITKAIGLAERTLTPTELEERELGPRQPSKISFDELRRRKRL